MSGRLVSQQSETVIDVSQGNNSSQPSSPFSKADRSASREPSRSQDDGETAVQVGETVDIVQDSFEPPRPPPAEINGSASNGEVAQQTNATPGAPLQEDDEDDEDEMYGLSPKGQSQHEMTKAARQSASKSQIVEAIGDAEAEELPGYQQTLQADAARSAIRTQPLENGAPGPSQNAAQQPKTQHPKARRSQSGAPMQIASDKSTAPAAHLQQTAAAAATQASSQVMQQPQPINVNRGELAKKPVRAAKQSALEALRAKNGRERDSSQSGQSATNCRTSSTAVTRPKAPSPAPKAAKDVPQKSKQLPTPVTKGAADRSDKRPTTGKLPTHQPRSFMTPSVETIKGAVQSVRPTAGPGEDREDGEEQGRGSNRLGTLKRPSKKDQAADLREQQKTALQSANVANEQQEPGTRRKGKVRRPARENSQRRLGREQSDTYDVSTPAHKRQRRSMSRASKASTVKTATGGRTRQRMQETSNQQATGPDEPQPPKQDSRPSRQGRDPQGVDVEVSARRPTKQTTVVKDREPGLQMADDPIMQSEENQAVSAPADKAEQPAKAGQPGGNTSIAEPPVDVQQDAEPEMSDNRRMRDEGTAVFLSERTSPGPSVAVAVRANKLQKPPSDKTLEPGKRARPQTPVFRSSPPNTGARSVLVPDSMKPSVISFGKGGPVNQGTGRSSAPGSAQTTRTVMHQTRPSTSAANASSRQKLLDRRSNVQSSAAKFVHNTRSAHHTDGNVAGDGEDVFDAFTLGGNNSNLAKVLRSVPKAPDPKRTSANAPGNAPTDDFANIDDLEGTTLVDDDHPPMVFDEEPTVSQVAMPPPGGKAKKVRKPSPKQDAPANLHLVEKLPAVLVYTKVPGTTNVDPVKAASAHASSAGNKRKSAPTGEVDGPTKRSKPSQPNTARARESQHEDGGVDSGGAASQMAPIKLRPKPAKQVQPEPVKRALRGHQKPARQASQGSVDITGSPYPKSMEVPRRSTALEVFSQQAGLSSDHDLESQARSLASEQSYTLKQTVRLPPPSTDLEILSSNSKPLPAPPQAISQAVCRIASGAAAERLLIRDQAREPPTDPFTSSEEQRQSDQPAQETEFLKALRESGFGLKPQADVYGRTSDAAHDPDKTLVEPEPTGSRRTKGKKRAISILSESSSDSSSQSRRSDVDEDVATWRAALKPHQANLFDSLVEVSHKLVRHLVDRETATADIVADYRRRGEHIVSSLERTNAALFDKRVRALADKRRQTGKELKSINDTLQSARGETQSVTPGLGARKKGRSKLESVLQEMAGTYA